MNPRASFALSLFALPLLALTFLLAAPSAPAQGGAIGAFEPVRARDLVVISSATIPYDQSFVPLLAGSEIVVYTVPSDRWLVLRDIRWGYGPASGGVPYLYEVSTGVAKLKYMRLDPLQSSCGISFAPGSQVVLRNAFNFDTTFRYDMFGYLVEP